MFKLIGAAQRAKEEEKAEEEADEEIEEMASPPDSSHHDETTSVTQTTEKPNPRLASSTHKIVEIPKPKPIKSLGRYANTIEEWFEYNLKLS